jgi:hypothetical protein
MNIPVVPDELLVMFRADAQAAQPSSGVRYRVEVPPVEFHVCPQCRGQARVTGPSSIPGRARVVVDHTDWCPFRRLAHRMRMLTVHSADADRR